jgi:hypothetical protein
MATLSIRAFDEAQRRKLYPERKGLTGVACLQRDILLAQRHLGNIAEILWQNGVNSSYSSIPSGDSSTRQASMALNEHLAQAGLQLLQLTGALGIDFISLLKQQVEKEELTVL